MVGTAEMDIHVPRTIYAGETVNGSCVDGAHLGAPRILSDGGCMLWQSRFAVVIGNYSVLNFSVICANGSHNIHCFSRGHRFKVILKGMYSYICSHIATYTYVAT